MTGLKSAFARTHNVNADPELKFAAAMVAAAAEDARHGDCDAYTWLDSPCSLRWLVAIVPMEDDCERVRTALLSTVPEPAGCDVRDLEKIGTPMQSGNLQECRHPPSETTLFAMQLTLDMEVF